MAFELKPLAYAYDALEEVIDERTMKIHHDKHHQAYVNNLNKAVEGTKYADMEIEELIKVVNQIPEDIRTPIKNNGGGHYNHEMFWEIMTPGGAKEPVGELKEAIIKTFGSFEEFKEKFEKAGATRFGSGWVSLVSKDKNLEIVSTPNQDSPVSEGYTLIFANDVWEHAYYLRYQNQRATYLKEWWKVVNWDIAEKRYQESK